MTALTGVRVVALEQAVAAPLCSRHLADLGADVIKVERPDGGDFARRYDTAVHGESAYFVWLNRGKRSVTVDLAAEQDRELFDALLGSADVFLHNLGPGAVDRLGYGWDDVHERWPRLISCAVSGYGSTGPLRGQKAFDLLVQGEVGLASVTGTPEQPSKVGISIADIAAGVYAVTAILAALIERDRSAVGQRVEVSMFDALAEWMSVPALYQRYRGAAPARSGLHHATIAPYGPFAARDGGSVLIAVQNEAQWVRLCRLVLRRDDMADDPSFATNELRVRNRQALDEQIADCLGDLDHDELGARLDEADVPRAVVNDVAALLDHPQLVERGRWIETETSTGPAIVVASPVGSSPGSGRVPSLGEDTEAVRRELGLTA